MTSNQYEELCRRFIADKLNISLEQVLSIRIPNPTRPGLPTYKHQIDLYWEREDELALYLNIANAKWRNISKVDQPDVLLLQQVKQKVAAHKALMITNTGFTSGAIAVAKDEGIGLHIVRPKFEASLLSNLSSKDIQAAYIEIELHSKQNIYEHQNVYKYFQASCCEEEGLEDEFDSPDVDTWYLTQLRRRRDYLVMLWQIGYEQDVQEIVDLEREIDSLNNELELESGKQ